MYGLRVCVFLNIRFFNIGIVKRRLIALRGGDSLSPLRIPSCFLLALLRGSGSLTLLVLQRGATSLLVVGYCVLVIDSGLLPFVCWLLVVGSFLVRCCVVVSSFWVGVSIPRSLLEEEVCWALSNR